MLYNAENNFDCQKATERLKYFIVKKKKFELTEKKPIRTLSQNNYLHLILSYFALDYGDTLEHVKEEIFKKIVNPDIFVTEFANRKTGEIRPDLRSSADLNTREMTMAIDRFRDYSSIERGLYLPIPEDLHYLEEIEKEINNNNIYL